MAGGTCAKPVPRLRLWLNRGVWVWVGFLDGRGGGVGGKVTVQ